MADVINLRQARKRRARDDRQAQAAENRARFGRSPEQAERDAEAERRRDSLLDASRIDSVPDD